jgi:hypothetical protein
MARHQQNFADTHPVGLLRRKPMRFCALALAAALRNYIFSVGQEKYLARVIRKSARLRIVIDAPPRSIRTEMNLVGLLTHASSDRSCLPNAFLRQWLLRFAPPRSQWRGRAGFSPASQTTPSRKSYTPARKMRQAKTGKYIFMAFKIKSGRPLHILFRANIFEKLQYSEKFAPKPFLRP